MRRLGGCCSLHGLDQQGGSLQWIVAALPCFPEDPLFTLLPLPWDRVEVLSIQIGMAAGAKPPATREALGTVKVPSEVVVLVPGREGQGKAIGGNVGGTQLIGRGLGELQAVGCVLTPQMDRKLEQFGIAIPVLELHSQLASSVPCDAVHLL